MHDSPCWFKVARNGEDVPPVHVEEPQQQLSMVDQLKLIIEQKLDSFKRELVQEQQDISGRLEKKIKSNPYV